MTDKELVFGTYYDSVTNKSSSLNGSSACFVLAVEDADAFIERHRSKNGNSLAILCRTTVSEQWASQFLEQIKVFALPHNKNWYRLSQLDGAIDKLNETHNFKPKTYLPNL